MQKNFTSDDDFEDFLKRSAEGLRMPPSEKVWEGISKDLKKRRRRIGYFTSAFLLLSGCLGYLLVNTTKEINPSNEVAVTATDATENADEQTRTYPSFNVNASVQPNPNNTTAKVIPIAHIPKQLNSPSRKPKNENSFSNTFSINKSIQDFDAVVTPISTQENTYSPAADAFETTIVDSDISGETKPVSKDISSEEIPKERILSIESVTNIYRGLPKKTGKFSSQFYFTPTVSYRKLSENKSYQRSLTNNTIPATNNVNDLNVNNAVTHKPDIGIEIGMAAKYQIAKSIKLRGGVQFNVNRYDIKAFAAPTEMATIALTTGANQVDFVGSSSNYRNFNGYHTDWLQNFYIQLSAPVGLEFKIHSHKNTHFGIASTIQPTYVLGEKAYMLSTDYKNYTEVPWLSRKWNVNTSIETYVAYSTGKMNWQIGPQVRYQLLSSYISKYPLKENLFDFGLRIGMSINKIANEGRSQ
ncbi:MAG TPA: hypothetical protein VEY32_00355 [Flavisolibacter sp.]|nr:hypothetical protein [Flavisolibacter sp.]